MYKVTIVIPVFNAESCLDNAINSIINQTIGFENIELILVDDCSSDNSRSIINKYSNKYDNIVPFFADENHGFPGYGRNVGIDMSSSEYLMFLDNDDQLDYQMCEKLYNAIEYYDCDIACCDIRECDDVWNVTQKMGPSNLVEEYVISYGDEIFNYNSGLVWNKLFKKDIINKFEIKFLVDNYCDDTAFCVEYMMHSNKLVYLNGYVGYLWMRRSESLSNSKELKNLIPLFWGYSYILDFLIKNNKINLLSAVYNPCITYLLGQSVLLKSKDEKLIFFEKLYEFEIKYDLIANLSNPFFSFANFFILKKKFNLAYFILLIYSKLKDSSFLRKLYLKFMDNYE